MKKYHEPCDTEYGGLAADPKHFYILLIKINMKTPKIRQRKNI